MHADSPDELRFARRAARIREQFGSAECARLLGVNPARVHRWSRTGKASESERRRVEDLQLIGDLFSERGMPDTALIWLHAMNPSLNYETPAEEILRGRWVAAIAAARDFVKGPRWS